MADETVATPVEEGGAAAPRPRRRGRWVVRLLIGVALAAGLFFGGRWVVWRIGHVSTDAGFVKAEIASVAPQVAGRILQVAVVEGQQVRRGDTLVEVDPAAATQQVAQAQAAVATALAVVEQARQGQVATRDQVGTAIGAAEAAVAAARTQVAKASTNRDLWRRQRDRFQALVEQHAVGRARFEEVESAAVAAESDLAAASAQVRLAEARLAEAKAARTTIAQAQAAVATGKEGVHQAEAALAQARLALSWCTVVAPINGVVARKLAEVGDMATPGRPVISLYDPASRYVEARFEETKLRNLAQDKAVELRVDRLPGTPLTGRITLLGPAAAAEFALIPRDVTAGEFTKVTQRVGVRIAIDHLADHPELVPVLSVEVVVAK